MEDIFSLLFSNETGKGWGERDRQALIWETSLMYVPRPGIRPATFWSTGWCCIINWATPARTSCGPLDDVLAPLHSSLVKIPFSFSSLDCIILFVLSLNKLIFLPSQICYWSFQWNFVLVSDLSSPKFVFDSLFFLTSFHCVVSCFPLVLCSFFELFECVLDSSFKIHLKSCI